MSEIKTNKISPRKGTTQTIGDSGDTVSIPCGVTITNTGTISTAGISGGTIDNQGTISGLQGVINWDTTAKTTNFNASSQTGYFVNTTSGQITITLPASPTAGDVIGIKDYANTFDTNKAILNANGNKIQGLTSNFIINVKGASSQFIYVDATRGWVLTDASKASDIIGPEFVAATGGTITTSGDYKIHTFTGPGTFTVSNAGNPFGSSTVDYLVVAGGGAGGGGSPQSGGGGAGGYRTNYPSGCAGLPISVTGYPITIGAGGTGSASTAIGSSGNNSIFLSITSTGGGGGGYYPSNPCGQDGNPGGSGGGNGQTNPGTQPTAGAGNTPPVSPPQGNPGGASNNGTPGAGVNSGTGGGGAGAAGGVALNDQASAGNGGAGLASSISGSSVTRAGGGGGARHPGTPTGGDGGTGGGGNGARSPSTSATSGTANTGGGGGGGAAEAGVPTGASGGSGIVIIRYKYQ
jgi:hypothetical protein